MPRVIFDRASPLEVDIESATMLDCGSVAGVKVEKNLKQMMAHLKTGKLCVTTSTYVNGSYSDVTNLFRVGEEGLVVKNNGDRKIVAIDVQRIKNQVSDAIEAPVLELGPFGYSWKRYDCIRLSLEGVKDIHFYNEGTFSPAGGKFISHPIGEFMREITVGQQSIRRKWDAPLREMDLRAKSVLFVLPSQYFVETAGIFGDMPSAAAVSIIRLLAEQGLIEKPLTEEEYKKVTGVLKSYWPKNITSHQIGYRTQLINRRRNSELARQKARELVSEYSSVIREAVIETITLNAISSVLNRSRYWKTKEGYGVREINKDFEEIIGAPENAEFGARFKLCDQRDVELIPSKLIRGVVYAVPKDACAGEYLLRKLAVFNERFPDTIHIRNAEENNFLSSIIVRK